MAEYDGSINIKTLVDKSDFFTGINQIKYAIKSLQSTIENIGEKIGSSTTSLIGAINKKVQETATITEAVSKNVDGTTQSFEESNAAAETLKETVESIENAKENINKDAESNATSSSGIKADTAKFMNAAQEFFRATNEFENTVNQTSQDLNVSVVGYANAMKNNVDATKMLEEEIDKLKAKRDELSAERSDVVNSKGLNPKQYNEITEELRKVNAELERLEKLKAEALKPTFLQDWERMPKFTTMLSDTYSRFVNNAVEGFARVKNAGQVGLYGIQHPLEGINRMLGVAASSAVNFAKSLGDRTTDVVSKGLKSVGSSALRAVSSLVKIAGSGVISFLKRIAVSAKNAAVQLAKMVSNAVVSGIKKLGSVAAKAGKALFGMNRQAKGDSLKEGLRFIIRYGFGVRSLFMLVRKLRTAIKEAFENLAMQSPEVNKTLSKLVSSLDMLKNTLATAFQPILTAAQPLLTSMMDMLSEAMTKVGMFFAALTGQDYVYKATKANIDYAKSLDKTKKSAKEAENQLASFDKLDILKANKDNGSDTDTNAADAGGFTKTPVLDSIKNFANRLKELFQTGDFAQLGKELAEKINGFFKTIDFEGLANKIGGIINKVVEFYNAFMEGVDWDAIGRGIATGVNGLLKSVDWNAVGKAFSQKINAIFGIFYGLVDETKWDLLGEQLATAVWGFFGSIKWDLIGETIGTGISKASFALKNFALRFPWENLGEKVASGANKMFGSIKWTDVADALNKSFSGILKGLRKFIREFDWTYHGTALANGIKKFIRDLPTEDIGGVLTGAIKGVIDFILPTLEDKETWKAAGEKLATGLNTLFGDTEMWAGIGETFNSLALDILEFANGALDAFKPEDAANAIKIALGRIQWTEIVGKLWADFKLAAKKFGSFMNVLFADEDNSHYDPWEKMYIPDPNVSIGTRIGKKLREAFEAIPWGEIYEELKQAAQSAFKGIGDFLVAVLNVSPDEFEAAGGNKVKAIAAKVGTMMQTIGAEIGKLPWGTYLKEAGDAIKTVLSGFFTGLFNGEGDGSILGWIIAGIAALKLGLIPILAKLVAGLGAALTASGPFLQGSLLAALAGVIVVGTNYIVEATKEMGKLTEERLKANISHIEVILSGYTKKFREDGIEAANEYARHFGIDLEGGNIVSNLRTIWDEIQRQQGSSLTVITSDLDGALATYRAIWVTEGAEAANAWAESALNMQLTSEDVSEDIRLTADDIDSNIDRLAVAIGQNHDKIANDVGGTAQKTKDAVTDAMTEIDKTTKEKSDSTKDNVVSAFEESAMSVEQLEKQMTDAAEQAWGTDIPNAVKTGTGEYNKTISDSNAQAKQDTETQTSAISGAFSGMFSGIVTSAAAMTVMNGIVTLGMAAMKSTITTAIGKIETSFTTMLSSIQSLGWYGAGQSISSNIGSGINSNVSWVSGIVSNMASNIMYTMNSQNWFGIGYQIVAGVREGIQANTAWISYAAEQMAIEAYNAACAALGIASPSKLFRDGVGLMIGYGLAEGLEDSQPEVMSTVSDMATAMEEKMANENLQIGVDTTDAFDGFGDKIVDGFETLISKLQAIADSVTFRTPAVAAGTVLPYNVAVQAASAQNGLTDALVASNDDLASVIIQATNNAALAIVNAIQRQGGGTGVNDLTTQTSKIIDEINRRARMQGASPIIV